MHLGQKHFLPVLVWSEHTDAPAAADIRISQTLVTLCDLFLCPSPPSFSFKHADSTQQMMRCQIWRFYAHAKRCTSNHHLGLVACKGTIMLSNPHPTCLCGQSASNPTRGWHGGIHHPAVVFLTQSEGVCWTSNPMVIALAKIYSKFQIGFPFLCCLNHWLFSYYVWWFRQWLCSLIDSCLSC